MWIYMWIVRAFSTCLNMGQFTTKTNLKQLVLYVIKVRVIHVELRALITFIFLATLLILYPRRVKYFYNMFFYSTIDHLSSVYN